MRLNQVAYQSLPAATRSGSAIEAVLLEYDISGNAAKPLWLFLVNPQSIKISRETKYTEISPLASSQSELQYVSTSGKTLSISELILQTWYYGKSLRPLLEGIERLLEANIKNHKYSPPILKFQMGSREFGPCVLTGVKWEELAWLSGEPASVEMSLELKEIPSLMSRGQIEHKKEKAIAASKLDKEKAGKPRLPLTDRQKQEAGNSAKKYLEANITFWTPEVGALIKSKKYKLAADANSGAVTLIGDSSKNLGRVLLWDGQVGKAGIGITTIPVAKNGKAPELK